MLELVSDTYAGLHRKLKMAVVSHSWIVLLTP